MPPKTETNPVKLAERAARKRVLNRLRKRRERARRGEAICAQAAVECEDAAQWKALAPLIRVDPHTGCWIWRGKFHVHWQKVRPVSRSGQYGRAPADVAVWSAHHHGKTLPEGAFLKRTCGNVECVSPHAPHALVTNQVVERHKQRRKGGDDGSVQEERQGRRQGLPRAV